jgi:hypothetical protein
MFTAGQIKKRLDEKPFRPFRIKMSNGETYDIPHQDAAWVLQNAIEIGLDPNAEGLALNTRRCSILRIASIEDIPESKAA